MSAMMSLGLDLKNKISCEKKRIVGNKLCFFPFILYLWIRIHWFKHFPERGLLAGQNMY